ncbi:MAG: SanA/YdcF family protein [Bacteroidia bacterium]
MKRIGAFFRWFVATRFKRWVIYLSLAIVVVVASSHFWIKQAAHDFLFTAAKDVPARDVALVLGASPLAKGGHENLFFKYRMEAAAALWKAGKVKCILVSGDNHSKNYDEATAMRETLNKLGVPDSVINLDFAGFRTLDSVVRCKEIFGQRSIVIVSQEFHNERALFIAQYYGLDAVALNAREVALKYSLKTVVREYFARFKCVLDLYVLKTEPKFLGKKETLKGFDL